MKATEKSPVIDNVLNSVSGNNRVESIENNICALCQQPVGTFSDYRSYKEYTISGMCESCQDDVFYSLDGIHRNVRYSTK